MIEEIKNRINESFVGILEAHKNMYQIVDKRNKPKWKYLQSNVYIFTKQNNFYIIIESQFTSKQFEKRFNMLLKNRYELTTVFISIDLSSVDNEYIKNFKIIK